MVVVGTGKSVFSVYESEGYGRNGTASASSYEDLDALTRAKARCVGGSAVSN